MGLGARRPRPRSPPKGACSGTPSEPSPTRTSTFEAPCVAKAGSGLLGQLRNALDGHHVGRELREHGGLVPGARADVEHALRPVEAEEGADRRHDERLRDRLALAYRERAVVVGVAAEALRHEELPRHAAHRVEHALVRDPTAAELPLDHLRARDGGVDGRGHLASVRSPAKRAAWRPRIRAARTGSATARTYPAIGIERDETDQHAERSHVRADAEPGRATSECADHDGRRGESSENTADCSGHGLRGVADQQSDRATQDRADDCGGADPEDIRAQDPRDRDRKPEPEARGRGRSCTSSPRGGV